MATNTKTINELSPVDNSYEIGENDTLPISVEVSEGSFETKKIKASALGGDASAFVVNFSSSDGETYTADKTMREIAQAIRSGAIVKGILDTTAFGGNEVFFFNLVMWEPLDDEYWETAGSGGCVVHFLYTSYSDGSVFPVELVGHYETNSGAHQFQDYWTLNVVQ